MKNLFYISLFSIILLSCSIRKENNNKSLYIYIKNKNITAFFSNYKKFYSNAENYKNNILTYEIQNDTNTNFAIPIDTARFAFYESDDIQSYFPDSFDSNNPFIKQRYQPAIFIKNNLDHLAYMGDASICDYWKNLPDLKSSLNSYLITIKSGQKFTVVKKVPLPIIVNQANDCKDLLILDGFYKNLDYTFELYLKIDSNEVIKNLTAETLNKLKKDNIKIFHGELISNKIPVVLE